VTKQCIQQTMYAVLLHVIQLESESVCCTNCDDMSVRGCVPIVLVGYTRHSELFIFMHPHMYCDPCAFVTR